MPSTPRASTPSRNTRSSARLSKATECLPLEKPKRNARKEVLLIEISDSEDEVVKKSGVKSKLKKSKDVMVKKELQASVDVRKPEECVNKKLNAVIAEGKIRTPKKSKCVKEQVEESCDSDDEPIQSKVNRKRISSPRKVVNKNYSESEEEPIIKYINRKSPGNKENKEMQKFVTPKKNKSSTLESELEQFTQVTPPKQRKTAPDENLFSPSKLFERLDLNSPKKVEPKILQEQQTGVVYRNARKALHSTVPVNMPGRENEHGELRTFIRGHLMEKTSGTMYVSGPPGTGKTASLSTILQEPEISNEFKEVYVNCTAIKSSGAIYSRIVKELALKSAGRSEKDCVAAIDNYLSKPHKMILLVLDEIDQLESKNQSVLYTIFEWPSRPLSKIILIGIANALDLTDRILPRLQARCELKPRLMHFAPYSKQQIVDIFTNRLKDAGVLDLFAPVAIQMLAGKVAAISGDVRKALDIGRRVVEIAEQHKRQEALKSLNNIEPTKVKVDLKHVMDVLNTVYGTANLTEETDDTFPLQQKIIVCSLLLILKKARNKDVTIGKLHEVYRKVCGKRNLLAVDQAEFVGLCSLIETKGIIRITSKKETRLHKVNMEWDEEEVAAALKDKQLMSVILQDVSVLGKM